MNKKYLSFSVLIIFILNLNCLNIFAEKEGTKIETNIQQVENLLKESEKYRFNDFEKSYQLADKAYNLALKINSEENVGKALLAKASSYYYSTKLEKAFENYNLALKVGKAINSPIIIGAAYNGLAIIEMQKGNLAEALNIFQKAEKQLVGTKNNDKYAGVLSNIGLIYYSKGDYKNALKYMLKSKKIYSKLNNLQGKGAILISLGNIQNILKENEGEKSFKEALEIGKKIKDFNLQTAGYVNLGQIFLNQNNLKKSYEYLQNAIKLTDKTNNRDYKAVALNNIGDIKIKEKKYKDAMTYYKSAFKIFQELNLKPRFSVSYANIGFTYLQMKNYKKAEDFLMSGYKLSKNFHQKIILKDCCKHLSTLYKNTNNFKKALKFYEEYNNVREEIYSKEKLNEIKTLTLKQEEEKKAVELEILRKNKEIDELKMKKQKLHFYQILGFLLISLAVLGFLYKKYLFKVKTNNQLEKAYEKMETLAKYDALTGLHNRHSAMERVEIEMVRMGRTWRSFGVMMLDIDNFKKINDTFGHLAGDKVLEHLSVIIKNLVRKQDVVARWGGEEFFIMLPETSLEGTAYVAEKIRENIENTTTKYKEYFLHITATIGVSVYDRPTPFNIILNQADKALYYGKEHGKNAVIIYIYDNGSSHCINYTKSQKII